MPTINLTWTNGTYNPVNSNYSPNANWINVIRWRLGGGTGTLIPTSTGLYVIANPTGTTLVYAGQAASFRTRFDGRSDALGNFNLRSASVTNVVVYVCSVNAVRNIDLAERWLVRILYLRDVTRPARVLQNVNLTVPFNAPNDGLTINNGGTRPGFVNAQYVYGAGQRI